MGQTASKKSKEAFAIVEKLRDSGTITDIKVAENYPKALLHLKERFDEETTCAKITQESYKLTPGTRPDEMPNWATERLFFFSTGGRKKLLEIVTCQRI